MYDRFQLGGPSTFSRNRTLTPCVRIPKGPLKGFEKAKAWLHVFCPRDILVGKLRSLSQICNKIKEMTSFLSYQKRFIFQNHVLKNVCSLRCLHWPAGIKVLGWQWATRATPLGPNSHAFLSCWQCFPFPGLLRDKLGSYDVAFYLAGIPPLIGGAVLCFIPWVHSKKQREVTKTTGGEKMEKMLANQNSLSSSSAIFKKESDSVI